MYTCTMYTCRSAVPRYKYIMMYDASCIAHARTAATSFWSPIISCDFMKLFSKRGNAPNCEVYQGLRFFISYLYHFIHRQLENETPLKCLMDLSGGVSGECQGNVGRGWSVVLCRMVDG